LLRLLTPEPLRPSDTHFLSRPQVHPKRMGTGGCVDKKGLAVNETHRARGIVTLDHCWW
jgi:hypothetical protein